VICSSELSVSFSTSWLWWIVRSRSSSSRLISCFRWVISLRSSWSADFNSSSFFSNSYKTKQEARETLQRGRARLVHFPKFEGRDDSPVWVGNGVVTCQWVPCRVYKALRYQLGLHFCSSFEFNFSTTPFGEGCPYRVDEGTVGQDDVWWYVPIGCQYNHRCIWYRLAAICDTSFDWGLWAPVWGMGGRRGLEMDPLSRPAITSAPRSNHGPILSSSQCSDLSWITKGIRALCTKVHWPPTTIKLVYYKKTLLSYCHAGLHNAVENPRIM